MREFFLARQPILDRRQELFAYELLFRSAGAGPANITSDLSATAAVIAHAAELGLEKVIGDVPGFLNVDAAVLMSDIFQFLPRDKIVLEIVETTKATPEVLVRVAALANEGFVFALDDVIVDTPDIQQLLPYITIVKIDLLNLPATVLSKLALQFKRAGKKLLAEKVETQEQFARCVDLGFDYFQGYYFAKPIILSGKKLAPSQLAVMRLLALVMSEADDAAVGNAIKQDASLGINLLRLVNTPAAGARHRITSLSQALLMLGREQLRRWLQIMLYAEQCKTGQGIAPLLTLATTRGKLLELLALSLHPNQRNIGDTAFTVGIMSLMDTLLGIPMTELLDQIPAADHVSDALLRREGLYGDLLKLAEHLEHIENADALLPQLLKQLQLSNEKLCEAELAAYEWSDNVLRAAPQS